MEFDQHYEKASLSFIELSNFKSFGGVQRIGPLDRNFIAVVGSNGAGKHNIFFLNFSGCLYAVSRNKDELIGN